MKKLTDLRNRPFLVVNTITRPARGVNTSKAGWANDRNNWELFENPSVTDRVSAKVMREATIIIDVMSGECVKSRFEVDEAEVVEHYMNKYKPQIAEAMDVWLSRMTKRISADPTLNPSDAVQALRDQAAKVAAAKNPKPAETPATEEANA